jgi:hypothetical protein
MQLVLKQAKARSPLGNPPAPGQGQKAYPKLVKSCTAQGFATLILK